MRGGWVLLWLLLASFGGLTVAQDADQDTCVLSVAQFVPQTWIGRGAVHAGAASPDGSRIALALASGFTMLHRRRSRGVFWKRRWRSRP